MHWTKCNSLVVNPAKSKCIIFGNSAEAFACNIPTISIVSEIKLLGVFFATNLSWDTHINYVIRLASRRLYALYVLRNVLEKKHLIRVYEALVRSILEYCSPLFIGLNGKNSDLLEKVQRRAHKIICNFNCNCNFQSISDRRLHCATNLFLNASKDDSHILYNILPNQSKIRLGRFTQPPSASARRINSFVPFATILVNSKL